MKDIRLKGFAEEVDFQGPNSNEAKHFLVFSFDGRELRLPVPQETVSELVKQVYTFQQEVTVDRVVKVAAPAEHVEMELPAEPEPTVFGGEVAPDEGYQVPDEEFEEAMRARREGGYDSEEEVPSV